MSYSDDRFREKLLMKLDAQNGLLKALVRALSPTKPYYMQDNQKLQEAPIETTSRELLETWANDMLEACDVCCAIEHDENTYKTYLTIWETKLDDNGETGTRKKLYFEIRPGIRQDEEVNICSKEENTSST